MNCKRFINFNKNMHIFLNKLKRIFREMQLILIFAMNYGKSN